MTHKSHNEVYCDRQLTRYQDRKTDRGQLERDRQTEFLLKRSQLSLRGVKRSATITQTEGGVLICTL